MMMSQFTRSLFIATLVLSVGACNKKKDKDDDSADNGGLALTGPAAFIGNWTGIYSPLNGDGKPDGDAQPVNVTFKDDGRLSGGTFTLVLPNVENANASGSWSEFSGKNLFLKIQKTTISHISSNKPVLDMSYDLMGSSVNIHNGDFKLMISRVKPAGGEGGGGAATPTTATGQWTCNGSGRVTELSIAGDYRWRATIKSEGYSMLLVAGSGQPTEGTLLLAIESSEPPVKQGSALSFVLDGSQAHLSTIPPSGEKQSLGDCQRH